MGTRSSLAMAMALLLRWKGKDVEVCFWSAAGTRARELDELDLPAEAPPAPAPPYERRRDRPLSGLIFAAAASPLLAVARITPLPIPPKEARDDVPALILLLALAVPEFGAEYGAEKEAEAEEEAERARRTCRLVRSARDRRRSLA